MNHHVEESHPPRAPAPDYQMGRKEPSVAFEPGNAGDVHGSSGGCPCPCPARVPPLLLPGQETDCPLSKPEKGRGQFSGISKNL